MCVIQKTRCGIGLKAEETFNISEVFKYFIFGQVVPHYIHKKSLIGAIMNESGGGALQLRLYGGVWPQDRKIDPSAD